MTTITEHIRNHLLKGIDLTKIGDKKYSKNYLSKIAWSDRFENLMKNRLMVGRFRYGGTLIPKPGKKSNTDNIASILKRLEKYKETGNQEHLVDIANLCLVEFCLPSIEIPVFFLMLLMMQSIVR